MGHISNEATLKSVLRILKSNFIAINSLMFELSRSVLNKVLIKWILKSLKNQTVRTRHPDTDK